MLSSRAPHQPGIERAIGCGDDAVAGSVVPCGGCHERLERGCRHRHLRVRHEIRLRRGHIGRNVGRKFILVDEEEAIFGGLNITVRNIPRNRGGKLASRFTHVGLQCRYIDRTFGSVPATVMMAPP
jgi:hypothetical protein